MLSFLIAATLKVEVCSLLYHYSLMVPRWQQAELLALLLPGEPVSDSQADGKEELFGEELGSCGNAWLYFHHLL